MGDALLDDVLTLADLTVSDAGDATTQVGRARTYLADGRCVSWSSKLGAGVRVAIDAEIATAPVPSALQRRFGVIDPAEFWRAWTAVEVSCKLRDVPILVWLTLHGLQPDPTIATRTLQLRGAVVTLGAVRIRPRAGPQAGEEDLSRA